MLELLNQYLQLALPVIPPKDSHSSTLWHSDLYLDNVFVDLKSKKITCIVDWQTTATLLFFYQCGVPTMFKYHKLVSNNITV
jgi:Phosphotransferase enzyme family